MQKLTEIIRGPSSIGKTHASKVTGEELTVYGFPLENYIHHLDFLWLYIIPQGLGYLCWRKHNICLCMQNAGQWNLVHAWSSLIQELSVPILHWYEWWKLCKDIFLLQLENACTSIQPFWIWQVKIFNATWGSTKREKAGAYLQDVCSQFKHHFTVNLNEFLERWRKQERKRVESVWAPARRTCISSWLLRGEVCGASLLPWLGFKAFPVLLETKVRENLPTQMWRKPNIQRKGLVNEA